MDCADKSLPRDKEEQTDHGELHSGAAPSCRTRQFLPDLGIVGGKEVVQVGF